MINAQTRTAIFQLHQKGNSSRKIARMMQVNRKTVDAIIKQQGCMPVLKREGPDLDEAWLRALYERCGSYAQRLHEVLTEEEGVQISYPSLTRLLRTKGISTPLKLRCERVPDEPGLEMQHDTSPYTIKFGDARVNVIASMLYLRYSKRRYLKFYPAFNRFRMKCFLHEALVFWGYAPRQCIIDNTNLARLSGTGPNAVIVPEMTEFARRYGFEFICHGIGHPNRKAGEERSFWTTETNFLPGREFENWVDLNAQALEWSTVRMENRPQRGLIPAQAFDYEKAFLTPLPPGLGAPCSPYTRGTDQYGYAAFDGNYYWVPGTGREAVDLVVYAEHLQILRHHELLIEYPLPPHGTKGAQIAPPDKPPLHKPRAPKPPVQEEEHLRSMSQSASDYLDFLLPAKGPQRHRLLRNLHALSRQTTPSIFIAAIERAHHYRIKDLGTLRNILRLLLGHGTQQPRSILFDEHYQARPQYQQGQLCEVPDLSIYDLYLEEPNQPGEQP